MTDKSGSSAAALDLGTKVIMLMGGGLSALAMVGITSVLPAIDTALAHSATDSLLVKQLAGGVGFAMALGSLAAGFLVERAGMRRILLIAALLYVVAGTAGLYLSDLRLLLASRVALGLAASTIQVTALVLINTRLEAAARARWMGLHIAVAMACTILGQPIAGFLGNHGWRWPFALYGIGICILPIVLRYREAPPVATARVDRAGQAGVEKLPGFWRDFPFHYLLLGPLVGSIIFLPMVYAPFLMRQLGVSTPSTIALILTADSIIGAIMASQYGWARKRMSHHGAFALSFATAAAGTLIAGFSTGVAGIIAGMIVYGFGAGWFVPNLLTALGEKLGPARQARALGLVKSAHFLSGPIALLAMEPVARHFGPQAALLAVSGLSFMLLVAVVIRSRLAPGR